MYVLYVIIEYLYPLLTLRTYFATFRFRYWLSNCFYKMIAKRQMPPIVGDSKNDLHGHTYTHTCTLTNVHTHVRTTDRQAAQTNTHARTHARTHTYVLFKPCICRKHSSVLMFCSYWNCTAKRILPSWHGSRRNRTNIFHRPLRMRLFR